MLDRISVIVPIGPRDVAWRTLLPDLKPLPASAEVLLVATSPPPDDLADVVESSALACPVKWFQTEHGRAKQLNYGAAQANNSLLWFLHCDSRIAEAGCNALGRSLEKDLRAIYFFDLTFLPDGPRLMWLNGWGANLRSRWLGLPFGDQGLCLSAELFCQLGGFNEQALHGEDHLLVWKAHQLAIPVRPVGAVIATSARKYAERGWLRTTCVHLWRTAKQAIPQLFRFSVATMPHRIGEQRDEPGAEFQPSNHEVEKPRSRVARAEQRRVGVLTHEPEP
jgi:hypothetical protein